jgi:hypothetical protein
MAAVQTAMLAKLPYQKLRHCRAPDDGSHTEPSACRLRSLPEIVQPCEDTNAIAPPLTFGTQS